jgi:hypothetical protein
MAARPFTTGLCGIPGTYSAYRRAESIGMNSDADMASAINRTDGNGSRPLADLMYQTANSLAGPGRQSDTGGQNAIRITLT